MHYALSLLLLATLKRTLGHEICPMHIPEMLLAVRTCTIASFSQLELDTAARKFSATSSFSDLLLGCHLRCTLAMKQAILVLISNLTD